MSSYWLPARTILSLLYTASLYARGTKRISQKVGEEGVEVALAATSGDKAELVCESGGFDLPPNGSSSRPRSINERRSE
ncbi:hypothetical protein OH492_19480 [Vibrio chagasii]|nr:hypothetical protein [Vibrio chagasii]